MFEFDDVKVCYGGACAVNHVSFTLAPGEIVGLFGENGAGKTTLMKAALGFLPLSGGTVKLDGIRPGPANYERIAYAASSNTFFGGLTAKEHLEFYRMQFPKFDGNRFRLLMEFFEIPEKKAVRTLSAGQKNQFETILALSQGADYIFMDEPFAGNDLFNREDFYKVLLGMLGPTECLMISTHLVEEIKHVIGRALLMKKGQLIGDITTEQLEEEGTDLADWVRNCYHYQADRVAKALQSASADGRRGDGYDS
ncbi:ATP-binding cassette domain-containing protein [Lachnotalea sp. AF33-28]|uniref:ATP-binding cassette domain-containing protein n=1 Tax=Lachnotalea sp. AF33-28 TaxID=2292046 RepID=UPI000E5230C2|nr:ABC transporter ATP-binding protein [Lachnotalea sp. AF33-28]RHP30055.1 ABC transporter ATP-binding protein [Lachnotalea sp. AF33-28]